MSPYIEGSKNAIDHIVSEVTREYPEMQLRVAFVGYRDFGDADQYTVLDFEHNITSFKNFVGSVEATGGADECEDVFGGLNQVIYV